MTKSKPVVELNIDGTWVDAVGGGGGGVLGRDDIKIKTGRSNWSSGTDTGHATFSLANNDGRWSPDNPAGIHFGNFKRNIPTRIGVRSGSPYLLSGLGTTKAVASTPDIAGTGGGVEVTPVVESTITSSEASNVTTHTYDFPVTVNVGDRLLLVACLGHATAAVVSGLDDWTLLHTDSRHDFDRWFVYDVYVDDSTLATALSGGSCVFSTNAGNKSSASVARISGARDGVEGVAWDISIGSYPTPQINNPDAPSLTTTWAVTNNLTFCVMAADSGPGNLGVTVPTGYTDNVNTGGVVGHKFITAIASKATTVTTEDPGVWALDSVGFAATATLTYRPVEDASTDGVLDIPGDIDLRIEFELSEDMIDLDNNGDFVRLAHKSSGADGWEFYLYNLGGRITLWLLWRDSSGNTNSINSGAFDDFVPFDVQHERIAVRVTLDVDNGNSEHVLTHYWADTRAGPWNLIGAPITLAGITDITTNDASVKVAGNVYDGARVIPLPGKVYGFEMYDGIGGTKVIDVDFTAQTVGDTSFTDSTSRVWTIHAGGEITDIHWRFHGELASIPTRWDITGKDIWAPVDVSGLFRRLRQGNKTFDSPIRRGILRKAAGVVQYWPCEERGGGYITRFGAAIGTNPIVVTNAVPDTGANNNFLASDKLATFGDSIWTATVDPYTDTGVWQIRWLQSIPSDYTGTDINFLHIRTTDLTWHLDYRDAFGGELRLVAFRGGTTVYTSGWITFDITGTDWRMDLTVQQNGTSLDWALNAQDAVKSPIGGASDIAAMVGSTGAVTEIKFNGQANINTWSVGHITLQSQATALEELTEELNAFDGETAAARIIRLCDEEGLAHRIQGDPVDSELMGPQPAATLMDLLDECSATDLGILFEPRDSIAVGYRTFAHMNNQNTKIAIDYSAHELAATPELDRDDQSFANDIILRNRSGTIARAVLDDGSALSISEPPVGAGRYDVSFDVNSQDNRLPILADRRLLLSSPDEPRISRLLLGLHQPHMVANPALIETILSSSLGDLIAIENNPSAILGATTIRQIIQGARDEISGFSHTIDYFTTPASPWLKIPGPITDLQASAGISSVLLAWTEPFNDGAPITSYDVERSGTSSTTGFTLVGDGISPVSQYIDSTAVAGLQYWYRIRATNSGGDAAWSNVVTATPTTAPDPPVAITNLVATTGLNQISLAWTAPTSTEAITSYDIQRSNISAIGPWVDDEIDLVAPAVAYVSSGLAEATEYWFRIRATSSEGDGPWSNIDSAITTVVPYPIVENALNGGSASDLTSGTFIMPATVNVDDMLMIVATVGKDEGAVTIGTDLGTWSETSINLSGVFQEFFIWIKRADGTEDGLTESWSSGIVNKRLSYTVHRISGVFATGGEGTAWDVATSSVGAGAAPDPPSLTAPNIEKNLWVAVYGSAFEGVSASAYPTDFSGNQFTAEYAGMSMGIAFRDYNGSATLNPGTFTLTASATNGVAATVVFKPKAPVLGATGTPPPTIPAFAVDTVITAGQNVKTIIEAAAEGTHFTLASGTHTNCENVKIKTDMHIRLATGAILDGVGKGYCFRPASETVTGVVIGGDVTGTRPIIKNYGNGTSSQRFGAVMGITDDVLNLYPTEANWIYKDVDDWFIYHLDFEENSSGGIKQGSNWNIYDCEIHGHSVTGISGDRIVGGLVHSCLVYWNGLNPATGALSNGANIKYTWVNGDPGRTSVTSLDRAKAQIIVSNSTFEATDRDGGPGTTKIGVWFDLDCKDGLVEYSSFDGHLNSSIYVEGGNDVEVAFNTVRNSDGHGSAFGQDFINGAICIAESTNCYVHDNTVIGCVRALINRMSNRSGDWYNSDNGSFVNYAWATGTRYWILDTGRGVTPAASAQSNMWTGGNTYDDNIFIDCDMIIINEGTDLGGMLTVGSTPADLAFAGNDYSGSSGIEYFNKSNTALANFAAWQALGYDV